MRNDPTYVVRRTDFAPGPSDGWTSNRWSLADTLDVSHFHPLSSDHRPITQAKLLHNLHTIFVLFRVQDRYVRCAHTAYQSMVSRDSCVEFFLQPPRSTAYFNFEINCGGTLLLYHIEDPTRAEDAPFRKFTPVPESIGSTVTIWHSLPTRVEPEIPGPVEWTVGCSVPVSLFEHFHGPLGPVAGQSWRGNFFKCGDETSHPHWASWSPIGEVRRFHQPARFASVLFAP